MSRELKFRVWVKTTEVSDKGIRSPFMGRVLVLDLFMRSVTVSISEATTKKGSSTTTTGSHADFNLDEVELMQYTGLEDKNGTEIYEGDIVKGIWAYGTPSPEEVSAIDEESDLEWSTHPVEYRAGWYHPIGLTGDADFYYCEVIGNIYENPPSNGSTTDSATYTCGLCNNKVEEEYRELHEDVVHNIIKGKPRFPES